MGSILDWQRRFAAQPRVYYVVVGGEPMGNYYESREAAELEVAFYHRQGRAKATVGSHLIHSLALAQERWEPATPSIPGDGERGGRE